MHGQNDVIYVWSDNIDIRLPYYQNAWTANDLFEVGVVYEVLMSS